MQLIIRHLDRRLPDGVCVTSHWTATKSVDGISSLASGKTELPFKEPSDPTFVAYEGITVEQAIEWTLSAMGQQKIDELVAKLDADILQKSSPAILSGVPWQETTESE
jgi:hypothetical protein